MIIDTGNIDKCGVNQDQWRVKDRASNLLVLILYSTVTAGKILSAEGQKYQTNQVALCLVLFFMQVHLVAVNCKGTIQYKERVMTLWYYFLFFLHIDGVCITTKRNWISECVSLHFLIMRFDIVENYLLIDEPSEYTNDMLRVTQREFTVRDFSTIINKLHRIWTGILCL